MLQGVKLLYLESESESTDASIRKIRISNKLKKYALSLGRYTEDLKMTSFGRLGKYGFGTLKDLIDSLSYK